MNLNFFVFFFFIFIAAIFLVILLLAIIYGSIKGGRKLYERRMQKPADASASASTANLDAADTELKKPKSRTRVVSLDAFRGLAIVCMIFANCGAGRYWWLEHATWDGIHFADFVFPSFLWIMGVCIPISVKSQLARNVTKRDLIISIAKVCASIILLYLCRRFIPLKQVFFLLDLFSSRDHSNCLSSACAFTLSTVQN